MPDPYEMPGFTPPGADAAANIPAPQPWQLRHERMAGLKAMLEFDPQNQSENLLVNRYNQALRQVENSLAPKLDDLFTNNRENWLGDIANGTHRIGIPMEGLAQAGDIEAMAVKIAQGLVKLKSIPEIRAKFSESPNWTQNIFKSMLSKGIVAQGTASKAGLLDSNHVTDVQCATQPEYLKGEWYAVARSHLFVDDLSPEQVQNVADSLYAVEELNKQRLQWLGPESALSRAVGSAQKSTFDRVVNRDGELYAPKIINGPEEITQLYYAVRNSQAIILGHKAQSKLTSAETALRARESAETGQDNTGEIPLVQQAAELQIKADENAKAAEAKVAAARDALEAAEGELIAAQRHREWAVELTADAAELDALQEKEKQLNEIIDRFDADPEIRIKQMRAALLKRPEDEGQGSSNLKDFYSDLATIDPEILIKMYDIQAESLQTFRNAHTGIISLMNAVGVGVEFASLRPLIDSQLENMIGIIKPEKWEQVKTDFTQLSVPEYDIEDFEVRLLADLNHLRELLNQ